MEQEKKTAITKSKILNAAETEFANNGFAAARVDTIAKEAGVNKQMIYAHFISKENLYATVLEIVYKRLASYEKILEESEFTGIETINKIVLKYFDFLMNNPSFVKLVLWENLSNASHIGNIHTTLFSGAEKLLRKGIEKGVIRANLDIEQTVMSLNMFCFSAFSNTHTVSKLMNRELNTREELKKRAEHIADVLTKYVISSEG